MSLFNSALFLISICFLIISHGYKITFHNSEETSTPIVYPVGPTARSHGKLRIKYWANLTAPTTTPLNFENVDRAIETYLNEKKMTSRVDDTKLYGQSGSSNILVLNRKHVLILCLFIIFV